MAAHDRNPTDLLRERLAPMLAVATRTRFFTLVSALERLTADAIRVGGDGPPTQETIRFRHSPEMSFSTGDVDSAQITTVPRDSENPMGAKRPLVEVRTTFLGLTGAASPLPLYLSEEVLHEDEDNHVKRDFLDVFHHRLVSILYRAVTRYSPSREHKSTGRDVWLDRALSISGMDPTTYVSESVIPPGKLVRLAPLVAHRGRGARTLEKALNIVLEEHLEPGVKVQIKEFAGGWVPVHPAQLCSLGKSNNILGNNAMLGVKVFDRSGRFQVSIGPLGADGRKEFSGRGLAMKKLIACVGLVVPEPLDFDVEIELSAGATRPFRLSTGAPSRLGTNTRLGTIQEGEVVKMRNVGQFLPSASTLPAEA